MSAVGTRDVRVLIDELAHVTMIVSVATTDSRANVRMSDDRLMIGKVAEKTRCNIETIRFYEKEALLPPPDRTEGGHRLYTRQMVERLVFIRRSRELGFSMDEIRELLSLVDGEQVSCVRVKQIADAHLHDVRGKIADLKKMERSLDKLSLECPGDDTSECPIIEALQA